MGVRFVLLALLMLKVDSAVTIIDFFTIKKGYQFDDYLPSFGVWALVFVFLFMYELIEQKKLSLYFILLNSILPFLFSIIIPSIALNEKLGVGVELHNFSFVQYVVGSLMIVIYYAIILNKRAKQNGVHRDLQMINVLLLFFHISWIFLLVWAIQYSITGKIFSLPLSLFMKLMIISVTLSFYFYLFDLYKYHLKQQKEIRLKGFASAIKWRKLAFIAPEPPFHDTDSNWHVEKDGRYKKSMLESKKIDEYTSSILDFFEKNRKIHLNPDFNLQYLSSRTGISCYHLSQVFNVALQSTFSAFLNKKRIEFAIKQLTEEGRDLNISELVEKCGYKSRTSFYNNFKKFTGYTLTQYLQRDEDDNSEVQIDQ